MSFCLGQIFGSVSALAGVNAGYAGAQFQVTDPGESAASVQREATALGLQANVYPGLCLWDQARGCPEGGEVIGAIFVKPDTPRLIEKFEELRAALHQTTLSVITPDETSGIAMRGFVVEFGKGDMRALAKAWQDAADDMSRREGFHVSGVVYQAEGFVYGQAEANPTRIRDLRAWERSGADIVDRIQPGAKPVFRDIGYHYLRTIS